MWFLPKSLAEPWTYFLFINSIYMRAMILTSPLYFQGVTNLGPATDFYKKLSLDCSAQQIAVDLFMMNGQYADIATLCKYHQ